MTGDDGGDDAVLSAAAILKACLCGDRAGAALLAVELDDPAQILGCVAVLASEMMIFTIGQATPLAMLDVVVAVSDEVPQ